MFSGKEWAPSATTSPEVGGSTSLMSLAVASPSQWAGGIGHFEKGCLDSGLVLLDLIALTWSVYCFDVLAKSGPNRRGVASLKFSSSQTRGSSPMLNLR